jgi:hypothetical protein
MNFGTLGKFGMEAFSARGVVSELRQARDDGDKLKMLDAVVHALAIATAVALLIREAKRQRAAKNLMEFED